MLEISSQWTGLDVLGGAGGESWWSRTSPRFRLECCCNADREQPACVVLI